MNAELLISLVPQTVAWSAKTSSIMILCNVLCIVSARYIIQNKNKGTALPLSGSFSTFGLPELLATTSLGHIIGSGTILGFSYIGLLS
ncbi:photosystem I subunit X (chloroplast) [Guillardia theta]|uniref:Photosystem I reaction center subunit PsaK n=2 Tax=Guillardia theta TaxID=55529 RepID=PSAK_GUITH|nr:photosystem I subunit X [Guillardia theta]O78444.1 RecName: Full=Photosystem I reaction center subunit PsaK; AltName: Full=PSI-K; AltName: Full=Photosystem I subunit X [Guillardia theta]AAC35629.1 PSI subunit X P37 [Guillardia theta]